MLAAFLSGLRGLRNAVALGLWIELLAYAAAAALGRTPLDATDRLVCRPGQAARGSTTDGVLRDATCAWNELDATGRLLALVAVAAAVGYLVLALVTVASVYLPFITLADQTTQPPGATPPVWIVHMAVWTIGFVVLGAVLPAVWVVFLSGLVLLAGRHSDEVTRLQESVDQDGQAARIVLGVRSLLRRQGPTGDDSDARSAHLDLVLGELAAAVRHGRSFLDKHLVTPPRESPNRTTSRTELAAAAVLIREWLVLEARRRPPESLATTTEASGAFARAQLRSDAAELPRAAGLTLFVTLAAVAACAAWADGWQPVATDVLLQVGMATALIVANALNEAGRKAQREQRGDVGEALLAHGIETGGLDDLLRRLRTLSRPERPAVPTKV